MLQKKHFSGYCTPVVVFKMLCHISFQGLIKMGASKFHFVPKIDLEKIGLSVAKQLQQYLP